MVKIKAMDIVKLVVSIIVCQFAGVIGSFFTITAIPTWYARLAKPSFSPPNWLFGPAWITLYLLMAIAAFLVWRKGLDKPGVSGAMGLFLIQLALNASWSVIFFGFQSPFWGVVIIILLWIAILFTTIKFFKISIAAGWLMIPYILWVTFASALNISIWLINR
jgi:benzodiazapine receptor